MTSKYLVRPNDMMIFEIDESNGCYRPRIVDMKNVPQAQSYFTYEHLTQDYNFFPIKEEELKMYEFFEFVSYDYMGWQGRPDGHGGYKGGKFEKYMMAELAKSTVKFIIKSIK